MLVLPLLVGCEGPTRTIRVPVGPAAEELARLDRAVAEVNRSRRVLLAGPDVVTAAATSLDAADEACATGQRGFAADTRGTARAAVAKVAPALGALPESAAAYRRALDELTAATAPLEPAQQEALETASAAGEQEAAAVTAFAGAATGLWPAYSSVNEVQSTWLDRASAGWFRSPREAANAYVVARRPVLPELEQARRALQQADAARRPATERMRTALAEADRGLASLRELPELPG